MVEKAERAKPRQRTRKWAMEQIEAQYPGFHPLYEMVVIAQKPKYRAHDKQRFAYLTEIAKFVVPKPRPLEILVGEDGEPMGDGKITIEWKK